jgi:Protein of unknown function (DUF2589)
MLFRRRPTPDDAPDGRFVWLDDFVTALESALFRANRSVRDQHIESLDDLYVRAPLPPHDGAATAEAGEAEPPLVPKTVPLLIPGAVAPAANAQPSPVDVPLAALVQQNPLIVDELTFDLECVIDSYGRSADPATPGRIALRLDRNGRGSPARLTIKYRTTDPPEGVSRVVDAQLRGLQ